MLPATPLAPLLTGRDTAPAFWMIDTLNYWCAAADTAWARPGPGGNAR